MAGVVNKERLILNFHKLEGDFFHRLVHDLGQDPTNMRWVIAFWLWLESVGHHNFVRRAYAMPGPVVLRIVEEAIVCLRCLAGERHDGEDSRVTRLPCTNAFLAEPIDDVGYFVDRRDKILKDVNYMYQNVCLVVCVGNTTGVARAAPPKISSPARSAPLTTSPPARSAPLTTSAPARPAPLMVRSPDHATPSSPDQAAMLMMSWPAGRAAPLNINSSSRPAPLTTSSPARPAPLMVNSPDQSAMLMMSWPAGRAAQMMLSSPGPAASMMSWPGQAAPLMMSPTWLPAPSMPSSMLNPMAQPWDPMQMPSFLPENYRSLFVTFSRGYPVSRDDILEFFELMFGPCVEAVMLEKVQPGQMPVYGRVVLRSAEMIPVVLGGKQTAKFVIKGRHVWARVYVPNSRDEDLYADAYAHHATYA